MKFVTSTSQDSLFIELEPFVPGGISTLVKVGNLTLANELGEFYFSAVEGMKYSSTQLRAIADWIYFESITPTLIANKEQTK